MTNPKSTLQRWPGLLGLFTLAFVLTAAVSARGEVVTWLYQVQVPVADQSEALRTDAARLALRTVLTRISGVAELPLSPVLQAAERNPGRYYASFQYLAPTADEPLAVRFEFEPALTLQLSKALQLPVWWQNRPRVVPWLVLDDAQLVMAVEPAPGAGGAGSPAAEPGAADPIATLTAAINRRARERGLPLTLPTPDSDGLEPLAPQRVARVDALELLAASTGLNAEWLGQGRIEGRAGFYLGALRFQPVNLAEGSDPTDAVTFNVRASSMADLGEQIVDQLSDALAQRYAASGGGALTLRIQGVSGAQSLVDLLRYLRGLSFLDDVQIRESGPDGLLLEIDSQADFEQLQTLLAVDALLLPEATEGVAMAFGPPVFRWQG